jgi:hypothetical protein
MLLLEINLNKKGGDINKRNFVKLDYCLFLKYKEKASKKIQA